MAQITNCLKLISRINEGDQDSLISRIDELQALGVPAQRAQVQAAIDVLARLQRDAVGIQRSAKRDITETPEFKAWFGDSKVVDSDGKPLVVYHGTRRDVSAFDRSKIGSATDEGFLGDGFYFTDSKRAASAFAKGDGGNVIPAYLSIKNPYYADGLLPDYMDAQYLLDAGFDGVIYETDGSGDYSEYVALKPEQIKSAIGNNGQFDSSNPDITRSAKRDVTDTPEFKRWFGDSKVVDSDGKPLVVYHGSPNAFFAFDKARQDEVSGDSEGAFWFASEKGVAEQFGGNVTEAFLSVQNLFQVDAKSLRKYFPPFGTIAPTVVVVDGRAKTVDINREVFVDGKDQSVFDLLASGRAHPVMDTSTRRRVMDAAKNAGADGVVFKGFYDASDKPSDIYAVFEPTQIKSAIGNNGDYSLTDPDITRSAARGVTETPEFKRWFGDSKVVDAQGKPLVVYRGEGGGEDFTVFDRRMTREKAFFFTPDRDIASTYAAKNNWSMTGQQQPRSFYLKAEKLFDPRSKDGGAFIREWAKNWDEWVDRQSGDEIDPVDAVLDGRLFDYEGDWSAERWRDLQASIEAAGYDGARLPDWDNDRGTFDAIIVFRPEQIKSATGNNGQFDSSNPDITRSAKRSQYAWAEREDTPAGPVLRGDGFYLLPQREIAQDDFGDGGFGENGLLGHAERVVPGTRTFAFRIVGDDGKLAGVLVSDVDETGALRSIHDIEIDAKRSGLGSKIVATIAANTSEPIKIQDITNEADPFWTRIGVGYKDPYGDASLDWEDVAQYVGSRAAAPVDQDWTFAQDGSRGLSPDSYEVRELSPEELEGIQFSRPRPEFFSQLERAIAGVPDRLATMAAPQWKLWLDANAPKLGVKKDEIEFSGVKDYLTLRGKDKVTRDELMAYLADNGVKVQEVVLLASEDARPRRSDPDYNERAGSIAKYSQYTVPGGENYREVLITLPQIGGSGIRQALEDKYNKSGRELYLSLTDDERAAWDREKEGKRVAGDALYRSSHWDTPNILAHLRVDDRTDADGNKVLFINEIQSDWGQDGKKKGIKSEFKPTTPEVTAKVLTGREFVAERSMPAAAANAWLQGRNDIRRDLGKPPVSLDDTFTVIYEDGIPKIVRDGAADPKAVAATHRKRYDAMIADARRRHELDQASRVPAAPFISDTKAWVSLALKRAIMMAVEGGYDRVALITGQQAADLYDLSKQISRVQARLDNGAWALMADDNSGRRVLDEYPVAEDELENYVGKELAQRIAKDGGGIYSGLDLKVGGEGMKAFYDKIVPNAVKALLKKLGGGQMEMVSIGESNDGKFVILKPDGTFHSGISGVALFPSRASAQAAANKLNRSQGSGHKPAPAPMQGGEQPGFDITPAMREKVSTEGLPLFSRKRGWQGFPDSVVDTNLGAQSKDPSYEAAKAGDMKAALELVSRVMSSDAEDKVRSMIGDSKPIVVSVHAEEAAGRNKIPLATAIELGDRLGLEVDTKIVQATRAKRTGADGMARIGVQPEFTGDVVRGADYLIVDDTLTQGGTIAQLKTYIEDNGGRVVGSFALSGKQYSAKISLDEQTLSQLREQYGSIEPWWRGELGYGFDGLTQSEARFILKSGLSPDQVRDRVAAARQAAGIGAGAQDQARLSAKRDVTDTPEFKRWFGDSKVVDAQGKPLVVYHGTQGDFDVFADKDERQGFYFAEKPEYANLFAEGPDANVMPAYLSIRKPAEMRDGVSSDLYRKIRDAGYSRANDLLAYKPEDYWELFDGESELRDVLQSLGFDGVKLMEPPHNGKKFASWLAFRPEQVKSAIGNNGQFDPANPNITRSAKRDVTDTPEFKRWFGDSKVVDAGGRPLVVYHGTSANVTTFSDKMRRGGGVSKLGKAGIYFTTDAALAALYGEATYPVYLKAENPLSLPSTDFPSISSGLIFPDEAAEIQAAGYDAVTSGSVIVVFNPEQIKSATGNSGQFDPASADITKSLPRIPGLNAGPVERTTGDYGREYTPQQLRMFKNVGRTTSKPALIDRLKEARKDLGKKMAQGIVDQFRPIRELGGNAYTLARLSKGSAGAFEALLGHGKLKIVDGAYDADTTGGFLDLVGKPLGKELEDFMFWVASNRAETLSLQDREHLFTQEDIDAGKSLADGDLEFDYLLANGATTRDRRAAYEDALKKFNEFNKNVLDIAEQSGLIDGESRQFWEGEFYVPFYRVSEEDGEFVGAKIKGGLARQRAFHELKGGSQKLNSDLLANTMRNWAHLIDASAKNRAAKATLEAAQAVGIALESDAETVRQLGKSMGGKGGTVWFMDGGQQRHFLIGDPYLLEAINSLEYAGLRGPLMDALSTMKHWLTVGVTASPAFKVRNLIRDSIQAISLSGLSYNPVKNLVEGYKATDRASQDYVSALASGGLIRFGTMLEGNAAERVRRLVQKGVPASTILNTPGKVKDFYGKFVEPAVEAYQELGNRGEEINRASLYKQLRAQGVNHAEASLMARDLMDFSMQGTWTSIRFLTQVVPFLNARLQGLYKLGRGAAEDPKRFAMVAGATALVSIALLGAYGDDDDWKKREDWDRDGFWWFKFGGTAFRIPKPFEVGVIATLAERGVELFTNDEFTAKRFGSRVMHLLGDNLAMNPIPQAVKPMLDIYANKDSFSGRPIESMGMERIQSEYRYNVNTSMIARGASSALNAVTRTVGADSLSPVQIDSLIRGYFGWLGTFVVAGADMAIRPLTSEPARPQADYLRVVTQGFLKTLPEPGSKYVSAMYDQAKILEQAYATHRQLLKEGKLDDAREFAAENRDLLDRYRLIEAVKKTQSNINRRIREIEISDMDPARKRDEIQKLRDQADRSARAVY